MKNADEGKAIAPPHGAENVIQPANRAASSYGSTLAPMPEPPPFVPPPTSGSSFTPANEAFSRHTPSVSPLATTQSEAMLPAVMPSAKEIWRGTTSGKQHRDE